MNETKKMKGFLRGFLMGFLVLPAALGLLVIFHVLIDSKSDGRGGEITNRIARAELIWLAMNKPKLFCESFDWVCEDVQEHHEKDRWAYDEVIEKKQNSYYMHLKGLQTSANWFSNLNTYQREEFKFISFTSGPVDPNPEQLQLPAATWNMLSWHGWAARGKKKNQAS